MKDNGHGLISIVEREPDAIALVDGGRRMTYADLLRATLKTAGGLQELGVAKGDRLLTVLQNNWQAAVLHWACQLTGVVITPVNWRANSDEINYFLTDSGAAAIVYQDISAPAVKASEAAARIPRISVGVNDSHGYDFNQILSIATPVAPVPQAGPDDISLMLYTSGTTGAGKGVPRSHLAERSSAIAHVAQNLYTVHECGLGVMPLYHTMGVRLLLSMSVVGGCFVCQPRFDAGEALDLISRYGVSCLYLVPTLYHDLITHERFADTDISSVRKLGFAGAAMTDGLLQRLNAAFEPELFVNHYGSSEIYTFTVCDDAVAKPGSAGKSGINQHIRVVDLGCTDPDNLVGPGEEGQIIASLESIEAFTGYWNRPDADAKSLCHGWYFTGDIGYMDEDGDLFVTGRVDDMIISGGENVLPAEIESLLSMNPGVSEVAVVGLPHERWGQQVTAFIKKAAPIDEAALDEYCRASQLANFKRPRAYIFVDEIPKSPVGKILRRRLRDAHAEQPTTISKQ